MPSFIRVLTASVSRLRALVAERIVAVSFLVRALVSERSSESAALNRYACYTSDVCPSSSTKASKNERATHTFQVLDGQRVPLHPSYSIHQQSARRTHEVAGNGAGERRLQGFEEAVRVERRVDMWGRTSMWER